MKRFIVFAVVALFAVSSAASAATTLISENWENGISSAWTAVIGSGGVAPSVVNDATAQLLGAGNHAMKNPSAIWAYYQSLFPLSTEKNWSLEFDFFNNTANRDFAEVRSYSGGGITGTMQQVVSLGVYNTIPAPNNNKYNFRIALGTTGQTGTPTQSLLSGWGFVDATRANSVWHHMKIEQVYVTGATTATEKFYVDGNLVGSWTTTAIAGPSAVRLGSGLATSGAYYDNIVLTVGAVPEPGSMLALGTGLVGLLGLIRRKRS